MKKHTRHIPLSLAAMLAVGLLAATTVQAQIVLNTTITLTVLTDNSQNQSDNGTVTTIPAPTSKKIATKDLLGFLAQDEFAAGNYGSTNFPTGAKLALISTNGQGVIFFVVNSTNNIILDVSDIIQISGNDGVFSGKQSDNNFDSFGDPLASPSTTDIGPVTFSFDDTWIAGGGNTSFSVSGLHKGTTTDGTPNVNTGVYTESQTHAITSLVGSGVNGDGNNMVITGTSAASGKATFSP